MKKSISEKSYWAVARLAILKDLFIKKDYAAHALNGVIVACYNNLPKEKIIEINKEFEEVKNNPKLRETIKMLIEIVQK